MSVKRFTHEGLRGGNIDRNMNLPISNAAMLPLGMADGCEDVPVDKMKVAGDR